MCGLMSINGTPKSGATRVGVPIVDYVTGYNALTGILLALPARATDWRGTARRGDAVRYRAQPAGSARGQLALLGPHAGRLGSAHPNIAPYDKFAAGDGEIFLGILNDGQFRRFCQKVDRIDLLDDPRFRTNADRLRHVAALRTELGAHAGRLRFRRSLPRTDAGRGARGRREHRAASVRAATHRPP